MKSIIIAAGIMMLPFVKDMLEGRWESRPSVNGNVTGVVFKPDNTFEGYINRKPFVSGKYSLQDDVFTFTDNGCNGAQGEYRIIFFSNGDSLKFQCISDSCTERRAGMTRLIMGRVKR